MATNRSAVRRDHVNEYDLCELSAEQHSISFGYAPTQPLHVLHVHVLLVTDAVDKNLSVGLIASDSTI